MLLRKTMSHGRYVAVHSPFIMAHHVYPIFTWQAAKDALEKAIEGADVAELENALEEVQKWEDLEEAWRFCSSGFLALACPPTTNEHTLLNLLHTVVGLMPVALLCKRKVTTRGLKALEALKLQQASQDTLKAATEGDDVEVGKGVGKSN